MKKITLFALTVFAALASFGVEVKPIKVLMITGGGWHDYKTQAPLLKKTIESQVNAEVTIKWTSTTEHPVGNAENKLPEVFKGDFCKGYDVIFHNHCHVKFQDDAAIDKVIDNHVKHKVGVIMTHGSFHTWMRTEKQAWDRLCGTNSTFHHHKSPIKVEVTDKTHPVMKALGVDGWETKEGELYSTKLNEHTKCLAKGTTLKPHPKKKKNFTEDCIFSHTEEGLKMFGTTLGHHNSTMEQKVYQKMMGWAVLWAAGKLDKDGKPAEGYKK